MKFDMDKALTRAQTLDELCRRWNGARGSELVPLSEAAGRVSSCDIYAVNTLPVFRVSSFDGFAVRSSDFEHGLPDTTAWKRGVEYVPADTGDDFPDDYDTIIAVEDVSFDEQGRLHLAEDFEFVKGDAVRPAGSMLKEGQLLVRSNTLITPELTASLAAGGIYFVPVIRRLKIAFIPTGTELIPAGMKPRRGENVEANGLMLSGFLRAWGADTVCMPIVRDDETQLEQAFRKALECADLVIVNGGSSRGSEDFNARLIQSKASYFSHGVKAVPGRPVGTAIINGKPVVNVPGPVLAAWLAADWLLKGLVYHYYGMPVPQRETVKGTLTAGIKKGAGFEMLSRVRLERSEGGWLVTPLPRSSTLPDTMLLCDGLLTVPIGVSALNEGDEVEVELIRGRELI